MKITSHLGVVELHSLATNQLVHVRIINDNEILERDVPFADLENPGTLIRTFTGNFADALLGSVVELARLTDTATPHIDTVYALTKLLAKTLSERQ